MVSDKTLWVAAVVLFVVGDVVTTWMGLALGGVELHPGGAALMQAVGVLGAVFAGKGVVLAVSVALWQYIDHPGRVGIPLGLAGVGAGVTLWNGYVIVVLVA